MIHQLDSSVASILATYFSVLDLSSLSQVSPNLRYLFIQYSWRRVFVIPHIYLNHGTDKAFKMYEYQVISVEMLTELVKYQWIKRNCVQELVLSPMCVWTENSIIDQIDIGNYFPYLQSIYSESHSTGILRGHLKTVFWQATSLLYRKGSRNVFGDLIKYQKPSTFTGKIVLTAPKSVTVVNLLLEDELHLYNISNLEILTSLHVSYAGHDSSFEKLTDHLKRCINVQRFIFTPSIVLSKSQYSLIYSVINNSFSKLKFLKLLHDYGSGKHLDFSSNVNTVKLLSNKNIECFEICMRLEVDFRATCRTEFKRSFNHFLINLYQCKINFAGVHGLEFLGDPSPRDQLRTVWPIFTRKIYAPDLKHFKNRMYGFGRYLNSILLPVQNTLVTLNVAVMYGHDILLFVSYLPKFKNLKCLVVQWTDDTDSRLSNPYTSFLYAHLFVAYSRIGWKYDLVYSHIRDGDIKIDEIKQLSDEAVQQLKVDILIKNNVSFCKHNEDEGFIETMTMMIKCPEKLVQHFGNLLKPMAFRAGWGKIISKEFKLVPLVYSFWDSVFNTCKDLTKLEVLKIFQTSMPFVSPHFNNLIHNHKSRQLKSITIGIMKEYSKYILPKEQKKLTYGRYLYKVKAPFANRNKEPYMGVIDYIDDIYELDIESMKKDFKGIKRFREEEMKHGLGYLDSTFKQGNYNRDHSCEFSELNTFRVQYLGSKEIKNADVNLGHRW